MFNVIGRASNRMDNQAFVCVCACVCVAGGGGGGSDTHSRTQIILL